MHTYFHINHKELVDKAITLMPEYVFWCYNHKPKFETRIDLDICNDDEFIFEMLQDDIFDNDPDTFEHAMSFISGYLAANNIKIEDF